MDGFYQTPRKDIVEELWVEFLTFIKQKEADRRKQDKANRLAEIKRLATEESDAPTGYAGGLTTAYADQKISGDYDFYDASVYGFWRWYSNEKIDLES